MTINIFPENKFLKKLDKSCGKLLNEVLDELTSSLDSPSNIEDYKRDMAVRLLFQIVNGQDFTGTMWSLSNKYGSGRNLYIPTTFLSS